MWIDKILLILTIVVRYFKGTTNIIAKNIKNEEFNIFDSKGKYLP